MIAQGNNQTMAVVEHIVLTWCLKAEARKETGAK